MRADAVTVALCRTAPDTCSPAALRFIAIVDEASLQDGVARIGHLNRAVNLAITLKRQDFPVWRSPLAVLAGQEGDCKASAVVKYVALGDLGVGDRRIVTVHVKSLNEEHAVVAVRGGIGWLILDNRTMSLVDSDAEPEYEPVLELDENGVREFISPNPRLGGLPCTNAAMFAEGAP
jgi:predicted transglutaminase-like cysteine proteinase